MMTCFPAVLLLSLINIWIQPRVTASAPPEECPDKPVFTPPSLVVRYGHPAAVVCSVCEKDCLGGYFGLEKPVGTIKENGTKIFWQVDSLTEWDTSLICYYNVASYGQCRSTLHITVYQPPTNVSIRFVHGNEPLLAGQSCTLECGVQKVAPAENLMVTFYKGQEPLAHWSSTRKDKKPVDELFTFSFNATEKDDGAFFWCDAQLDLEVQVPPVVSSQRLPAAVHYKPRLISPTSPDPIKVTKGDPLELNCSAVGRPSPSYTWTCPDNARCFSKTGVYSIKSVSSGDGGLYTCTASNTLGTVTVNFNVEVRDYTGAIVGWVIGSIVLCGLIIYIGYTKCYKPFYTGQYNLNKTIHCCREHTPVPNSA